jgi:hypothetical protein
MPAVSSHFQTIFGTNGEPMLVVFSACCPLESHIVQRNNTYKYVEIVE